MKKNSKRVNEIIKYVRKIKLLTSVYTIYLHSFDESEFDDTFIMMEHSESEDCQAYVTFQSKDTDLNGLIFFNN